LSTSHRQILKATSLIGGSSVVNVLIGLLRFKVAALLLGPAGVGLAGLLQNLMNTGSTAAAVGFGTAGTRQIAEANAEGESALGTARRAVFLGSVVLALLGCFLFWLLRRELARLVLQNESMADEVGWLGAGVGLTIIAGSQTALLTGLRRLKDVATATVLSAIVGSAAGVGALFLGGEAALVWFVVAMPAAMVLVGAVFVLRLPRSSGVRPDISEMARQWKRLIGLGASFSAASLIALSAQLIVRIFLQRELGTHALGLFQASWLIATIYAGFVLQSMGTDYYPRLTATISDHAATCRIVNEQTEVALFLGGTALLAILAIAPWAMQLLYSRAFTDAAPLLRWQLLGDVAKLASWPLTYVLLAAGRGRAFLLAESAGAVVFATVTWLAVPLFGVEAAGIAYLLMYLVYLPVTFLLARRAIGFAWTRRVTVLVSGLAILALTTMAVSNAWPIVGAVVGVLIAGAYGVIAAIAMRSSWMKSR
jgi:PST family polysaccharide transporter